MIPYKPDDYITDQLIPYLGNKRKLLPFIGRAIASTGLKRGTFFDAFGGSTVVSRLAKILGYRVIANDWEPYAYYTGQAYIANNHAPLFESFGSMAAAIDRLNSLEPVRGYIASHYCPADDESYDAETERMFYTQENGRRIDAIREEMCRWRSAGMISPDEEAVLLATLIYQSAYCSNTSGVFKGFHRGWGGATKTAWYRIRSSLTLKSPLFWDNGLENLVFREDAATLADQIQCDMAYLDPPYNQHQYGSNYHLLNTIALWDKPEITATIDHERKNKAAIRTDWRTERRSLYCCKSTATDALSQFVEKIDAKFLLISYSTDGIIPVTELLQILAQRGAVSVVTHRYKRYRVSSQRPSHKTHNTEFVAIADMGARSAQSDVSKALSSIYDEQY